MQTTAYGIVSSPGTLSWVRVMSRNYPGISLRFYPLDKCKSGQGGRYMIYLSAVQNGGRRSRPFYAKNQEEKPPDFL